MSNMIRWDWLAEAMAFYVDEGFTPIEVPWIVEPHITRVTLPEGAVPFSFGNPGDPVGSGEQGFVQMMAWRDLPPGRYVTLTPCFRDEAEDDLHQKWFAKVELIHVLGEGEDADRAHTEILDLAQEFLSQYVECSAMKVTQSTGEEYWDLVGHRDRITFCEDPEYDEYDPFETFDEDAFETHLAKDSIEIGSYGIREWAGNRWVYGTGMAEPRTSTVARRFRG